LGIRKESIAAGGEPRVVGCYVKKWVKKLALAVRTVPVNENRRKPTTG
jgi:hypothetical protein